MSKDLLSTSYGHQGQELWSEVEAEEGALQQLTLAWEAPQPSSIRTDGQGRSGWMSGTDISNRVQ